MALQTNVSFYLGRLTWFLFFLFTFFHLYANYRAVTCVVMNTLNQARLHIIMKEYLTTELVHILSPAEANAREPVLRSKC